jgi:hypothetical protein
MASLKRYDMKAILSDPKYAKVRRWMMANGTRVIQSREDIEVSMEEAYRVYDEFQGYLSIVGDAPDR